MNATREIVKNTYSNAAIKPQPGLCCPKDYSDKNTTDHIPSEVFDFNYGCGSPVLKSEIKEGEHVVDLGSGVGIDCFVASKIVGAGGRVTGVDMTDEMLEKSKKYAKQVAETLGYSNVDFKKGFIESMPLENESVDVVVSNCVLNLSSDKKTVFKEISRVLKPTGRLVIADIVSNRNIDPADQKDEKLWADCYTGALSVRALIQALMDAGFVGITQISESPWEDIAGYKFSSVTLAGYKSPKGDKCLYLGNKAIYLGPYSKVEDDGGHLFERFKPIDICTDTALSLQTGPYKDSFIVTAATRAEDSTAPSCCAPEKESSSVSSCCAPDNESASASSCCSTEKSSSATSGCC